jgi:hypothetical protein
MRCPDCNKFVSYDEPQCDVQSVEVEDDLVRATVTVSLNCQDCGTTLKDAEIEGEAGIDHECKPESPKQEDAGFSVESEGDPEGESRQQTTDRHGKPIKSARYMKTFYGFSIETQIVCSKCSESFSVTVTGEEQASGFNECC